MLTVNLIRDLLRPGLKAVFYDFRIYPDEWKEIFEIRQSDKAQEWEVEMKLLPAGEYVAEGTPVKTFDPQELYKTVYINRKYGIGFIITEEAIADNLYKDQWFNGAEAIKQSIRTTNNITGANVLNYGYTAQAPIADGQPFFSTAHPTDGGPVSNLLQGAPLTEAATYDMIVLIEAFLSGSGILIDTRPRKMIVPKSSIQFNAERITGSKYRTETANNDINALYSLKSIPQGFSVNHYLTNPTGWFVLTFNDGLRHYEREKLRIDMFPNDTTQSLTTNGVIRNSFGVSNFRSCAGSQGY